MNKKEQDEGCFSPPFPEDFDERLERLIELAGLSREEFAQRLGIDYDRVAEWFEGAELTGGEVWHVARLAWSIPGGLEIIVPGAGEGAELQCGPTPVPCPVVLAAMGGHWTVSINGGGVAGWLRRFLDFLRGALAWHYTPPLPLTSSAATFRSGSA